MTRSTRPKTRSVPFNRANIVQHLTADGPRLMLCPTSGLVHSIADFARLHVASLESSEAQIIEQERQRLPTDVPPQFARPMRRVPASSSAPKGAIRITRAGGRSAYCPKRGLHFKGCNPKPGVHFPLEQLEFGAKAIVHTALPFGCMTAEGTMRELLAYCFLCRLRAPTHQIPVCVFEYHRRGAMIGYCLVSRRQVDTRTEEQLDFLGLSIRDLIYIKCMERRFGLNVLTGDVGYKHLDAQWYATAKAKLLVMLNSNGGFRGVLNSNLGNDILKTSSQLAICDFDTFRVVPVPATPSRRFIDAFCLWCVVELIKTSTMIWDYLDLEGRRRGEAARLLARAFCANSLLWKSYKPRLQRALCRRGWDSQLVDQSLSAALLANPCYEMLLDVVPNSTVLKSSYDPALSLYMGHR